MSHTDKRIGFVLLSNSACPLPSTRIAVLNLFPLLRAAGYDPEIVFEPASATETPELAGLAERAKARGCSLVFFQKVHGASVLAEMRKLRGLGIRTVYGVCDRIDDEIVRATDATTIVTEFLRQQHASELRERIHIVHDGIERPDICHPHDSDAGSTPASRLRAVLVTSSTLETIPVIGRLPRDLDLTVVGRYPESPSLKQAIRGHLKRALLQPSQPCSSPASPASGPCAAPASRPAPGTPSRSMPTSSTPTSASSPWTPASTPCPVARCLTGRSNPRTA